MFMITRIMLLPALTACLLVLAWSILVSAPAMAEGPITAAGAAESRSVTSGVSPLTRLQQFISRADGDRCPMYPSCSHYARTAFAEKGILMGWVLTSDRLLRCGRDETRLAPPVNVHGVRHTYDPLAANIFWWDKQPAPTAEP
jgi:uncharacterized protein